MNRLIAAALLILPCEAVAQTTSTCGWVGDQWVCRTDAPPQRVQPYEFKNPMQAFEEGAAAGARARQAQAAAQQQAEVDRHAQHVSWLHSQVAAAISEHRCADAKKLALDNGDLDLAEQAQRLCQ